MYRTKLRIPEARRISEHYWVSKLRIVIFKVTHVARITCGKNHLSAGSGNCHSRLAANSTAKDGPVGSVGAVEVVDNTRVKATGASEAPSP